MTSFNRLRDSLSLQLIKLARVLPGYEDSSPKIADGAEWLVVRDSNIENAGKGLFTTRDIVQGERVCSYTGSIINLWQLLRTKDLRYIYILGINKFVDPGPHPEVKARFINHHFDPKHRNLIFKRDKDDVYLVAARDILSGEELYVDYGEFYWNTVAKL